MSNVFPYRSGPYILRGFPVASGVSIEVGDFLKFSSGKVTPVTTSTDNLAFVGVSAQKHQSTDPSGLHEVYLPLPGAVFEYDLNAATTIVAGEQVQINTKQLVKKSATDPIAVILKSQLSATTAEIMFALPQNTTGLKMTGDLS